jgi:hypothetical protein
MSKTEYIIFPRYSFVRSANFSKKLLKEALREAFLLHGVHRWFTDEICTIEADGLDDLLNILRHIQSQNRELLSCVDSFTVVALRDVSILVKDGFNHFNAPIGELQLHISGDAN